MKCDYGKILTKAQKLSIESDALDSLIDDFAKSLLREVLAKIKYNRGKIVPPKDKDYITYDIDYKLNVFSLDLYNKLYEPNVREYMSIYLRDVYDIHLSFTNWWGTRNYMYVDVYLDKEQGE